MKLVKLNDVVGVFCQDEEKQRDIIGEFVLNKYPNELTQKAIVSDLKQFSLWLKEKFQKSVFEVKAYELGVYRKHLIDLGYAVGSVNRKISSLKAFYRYLHEVDFNKVNVAQYLGLIKNRCKVGSTPAFSQNQLKKLFESFNEDKLNDLRDKVIVAIAFFCAARVSAVLNLKFDDVLNEASGLKLRLKEKGGKIRFLHCNSEILAPTLLKYLNTIDFKDGYLFRGFRINKGFTEKRLDRQSCHSMIKRRSKNLNLPKKFSMHSFRATFATSWLEKNYSIDSLQKIGGWENLDTVKRYDRNNQEASVSEMELMKI
jgi:integrase/recombinase XerC